MSEQTMPPADEGSIPVPALPAASRSGRRFLRRAAPASLLLLLAAIGIAWIIVRRGHDGLPSLSSSPFKNTGPDAQYVGSDRCVSCHKSRSASFRKTGMGVSSAAVDPEREPPDAVFDHPKSQRRYQIVRKDGKIWHRELLLSNNPTEFVLGEYPLKYAIGSGRHARTYVVEADGFLVESPITWYASRKTWDMSPGYDRPNHQGFDRPIGESCLDCHMGGASAIEKSQHRIHVEEAAISCERCHGPGSLHVALRTGADNPPAGDIDHTIVNPRHLPRELAEAVCQQCHLSGAATIASRGRKPDAFRPGLPLQDFRQDYWLDTGQSQMTVVGHVQQMHLSACYRNSGTLTCTTCHDPHYSPAPEKRVAYYTGICQSCHQPQHCKAPAARVQAESPENNCVQCHMPSAPTDIAHVAFTHHRIGIHDKKPPESAEPAKTPLGILRPMLDFPALGELDRKRSLGLAYLNLANESKRSAHADKYRAQALELLSEARDGGLVDPVLQIRLARLYFERNDERAVPLAERALASEDVVGAERCVALFVVAAEAFKKNQFEEARKYCRELVALRRHPDDWLLLSECEKSLGESAKSIDALVMAVRINPRLKQAHLYLAQHFRAQGDFARAAFHAECGKS